MKHGALSRAGPQRVEVIKGVGEKNEQKPHRFLMALFMPVGKEAHQHYVLGCTALPGGYLHKTSQTSPGTV